MDEEGSNVRMWFYIDLFFGKCGGSGGFVVFGFAVVLDLVFSFRYV